MAEVIAPTLDLELSPDEVKKFLAAVFDIQPSCVSRTQYAVYVEKEAEAPNELMCGPTVMLWGPPGIGKSSVVREAATAANIDISKNLMDIRLATLEPVDLRGVPSVELGRTRYNPPNIFPVGKNEVEEAKRQIARQKLETKIIEEYKEILEKAKEQTRGVILFDELPSAEPEIQIAAYEIILDRKIGSYEVPDTWTIVAAGNRESEARLAAHPLPVPLANRMLHIGVKTTPEDWTLWAQKYRIDPLIQVFGKQELGSPPSMTQSEEAGYGSGETDPATKVPAFLSPRSLEWLDYVNRLITQYKIIDKIEPPLERRNTIETALYRSAVGRGEAVKFKYWKGTKDFTLEGSEMYSYPEDTEKYYKILSKSVEDITDHDIEELARIKAKVSNTNPDSVLTNFRANFKPAMRDFLTGPITKSYYPNLLLEIELVARIRNGSANKDKFLAAASAIASTTGKGSLGMIEGIAHKVLKNVPKPKIAETTKFTSEWIRIIDTVRKAK